MSVWDKFCFMRKSVGGNLGKPLGLNVRLVVFIYL